RRSSVMSLPPFSTQAKPARTKYTTGRRAIEDDAETDAYADGPVEILPGVWLGAEDNATDWSALAERSIGAVLNVAKEVILSFEEEPNSPQHWSDDASIKDDISRGRHYAANDDTGRPDLLYLHLPWSHGQNDLVNVGFLQAMSFIDRCIASKIGVLIHCQCGISRSATLVIAYVMRAAQSPTAVPEVAKMKKEGMQGAYDFVKAKSQTIGPNMSLIYQLLE
ncbi:phosphatases II, partial [Clavulina sp. PMI_390]